MNLSTVMSKDTVPDIPLTALQIISVLGAGGFLYISRYYTLALIPAVILFGTAVFLAGYSHHKLFSLLLIGIFASLILSLRFEYLVWGDPWFEYEMIQRIIEYHSINPIIYQSQLPVIHVTVAALSLFSGIAPLGLLKYIIPLFSAVIGLFALYKFTKSIASHEIAFYAGILLLCGTPYLHWTTQAVRETTGIALFVLTIYISYTAIQSHNKNYLFLSLFLICGLTLTHDLALILFLLVWISISFAFLYLMCDIHKIRQTGIFSMFITSVAVIAIMGWGAGRSLYGYLQFGNLMNTIFLSEFGIIVFILILILLYFIPMKIPKKILLLRSFVNRILSRKNVLYIIFIASTLICSVVALHFVMGKSSFVLSYPLPMFFNAVCMLVLALIGLYYFLEIDRIHVIVWCFVLSVVLLLSMNNVFPVVDPLRLLEFLYIPLSIIAAFGITTIARLPYISRFFPLLFAVFVVVSVVTSFPSIVFFGTSFEAGHPLYDTGSIVIQHNSSEVATLIWLNDYHAKGMVETDTYVGYAARGIILTKNVSIQSVYPYQRSHYYSAISDASSPPHYLLILSRMKDYMEFGVQWMKKKDSFNDSDFQKLEEECNILYTNGNAGVYSYFSSMSSEYYFYYCRESGCPPMIG